MKRKSYSISTVFCSSFLMILFYCSCSVSNKTTPFELFSWNAVLDNSVSIIKTAFGKDVSYLIRLLGEPDYQTGIMEYIDDTRVSPYWDFLGSSFEDSTIPVKAYAWKQDDGYVLCCCSYNDIRLTEMPQCLIYHDGKTPIQEWLTKYSGDKGFSIMSVSKVKELSRSSLSYSEDVEWSNYRHIESISFADFYNKSFSFKTVGIPKYLNEMLGEDREAIIALLGEPIKSTMYLKVCTPVDIYKNCWIEHDTFPAKFYVDEYRFKDKHSAVSGVFTCYYKKNGCKKVLIFASITPDVDYFVQY